MQRLIITIIIDLYTIDKFFLKNHLTKTLFTRKEGYDGRTEARKVSVTVFKRLH